MTSLVLNMPAKGSKESLNFDERESEKNDNLGGHLIILEE